MKSIMALEYISKIITWKKNSKSLKAEVTYAKGHNYHVNVLPTHYQKFQIVKVSNFTCKTIAAPVEACIDRLQC